MPEPISVANAYKDLVALDELLRDLGELVHAAVTDGRYFPSELHDSLVAAMPDALDSLRDLRLILRDEVDLVLRSADLGRFDYEAAFIRPLVVLPGHADTLDYWPPRAITSNSTTTPELVERGLVGPLGRAKVKAWQQHWHAWGRKRGARWLRKALAIGSIPLNSFATGTLAGKGITEFVDLLGELLPGD